MAAPDARQLARHAYGDLVHGHLARLGDLYAAVAAELRSAADRVSLVGSGDPGSPTATSLVAETVLRCEQLTANPRMASLIRDAGAFDAALARLHTAPAAPQDPQPPTP